MKVFLAVLLCLVVATPVYARPLQFRGHFVDTYIVANGFLDSLPVEVDLGCEERLCSFSKAVRVYIFEHNGRRESFWSTDYCDVMFDEAEKLRACGDSDQLVFHDETHQLILRQSGCDETEHHQGKSFFGLPQVTAKNLK